MRTTKVWISEDHFEYGHIQFEVNGVIWAKQFPSYPKATFFAYRLGILNNEQMRSLREPGYPRFITVELKGTISTRRLEKGGFAPIKIS